jgi:hypothetical protein
MRHRDVPPPAESRREPPNRKLDAHLRQRFAGDNQIDQDDLFDYPVNKKRGPKAAFPYSLQLALTYLPARISFLMKLTSWLSLQVFTPW